MIMYEVEFGERTDALLNKFKKTYCEDRDSNESWRNFAVPQVEDQVHVPSTFYSSAPHLGRDCSHFAFLVDDLWI